MGTTAKRRCQTPIAVSMGDPAGIGLEICLKAWAERDAYDLPPFVLFADPDSLIQRIRLMGLAATPRIIGSLSEAIGAFPSALPVRPVSLAAPVVPGMPNPINAAAVITAIEQAAAAVIRGEAMALVTNPIAKNVLASSGFAYPGHTEFLAAIAQRYFVDQRIRPVMMLACEELRIVPLTIHIPLANVPKAVTREAIMDTARITFEALRGDFAIPAPRVVVTGLNPHGGEEGTMGEEERDVIGPSIEDLRKEGYSITGPHPADTLFHATIRASYDAVIAMYHDQALIPFKTIAFDHGVNVTLGLPFVRTSPDHGTAFDIAAKATASPQSFMESLKLAAKIATARAAAAPG